MDKKELQKRIEQGYLHVRAIVEVVGKPKKHVEETLKKYLAKIQDNKNYVLINQSIEPAEEHENYFSTFAEVEMLFKDSIALLSFCFDYMPSSLEIISPEKILIKNNDFAGFINDLQARLHTLNTGVIQLKEQNRFFLKNTAVLLRNFIVVLLSSRPMTIKEMHPYLGIKEKDIIKVLQVLIKEKKVKKEGEKYRAIRNEQQP